MAVHATGIVITAGIRVRRATNSPAQIATAASIATIPASSSIGKIANSIRTSAKSCSGIGIQ